MSKNHKLPCGKYTTSARRYLSEWKKLTTAVEKNLGARVYGSWHLCAEENGEYACSELVWEGGLTPEPWGDRWLKYEDEAKRLIALVRKHAPLTLAVADPLTVAAISAAARVLSDRTADACQVDREDHWKVYSDDAIADATAALEAARLKGGA